MSLLQELRIAWRSLRAQPAFTALAVLTMAVGIGANAVMFGIVDRLLLSAPAHAQDADRIARLYFRDGPAGDAAAWTNVNYPAYTAMRDDAPAFSEVAAYWETQLPLGTGVAAHAVPVQLVTASFFDVLGVRPAAGRFFTADEDRPHSAASVAVISDALWRGELASDPRALGREITLAGTIYTIIGIAPAGFTGADIAPVDIWIPMSAAAASAFTPDWDTNAGSYWLQIIARLRPGVSRDRARLVATTVYRRTAVRFDRSDSLSIVEPGPLNVALGPHQPGMDGRGRSLEVSTSIWLAAVAGIVLLIACANVAGLLGVRAMYQQRSTAVRLALGATRARLVVHFLAESTLIAALGGAAGLAIAYIGGHVVRSVLIPDVAWSGPPFNTRILLFTGAATLLTGIATGLAPALSATDISLVKWLRNGARDGGSNRHRLGAVLLAGQTALSIVLLAGATLFLRSLFNVQRIDLGMDASRLIVVVSEMQSGDLGRPELDALLRTASERLRRHAGIQSVSLAATVPFRSLTGGGFEIPGRDTLPRLESGGPYRNDVSPGFFTTLGGSFVVGRGFTSSARRDAEVVVNETLARAYWPGHNPVGSCVYLRSSETCAEVVGVVRDIRQWRLVGEIPVGQVYTPLPALSDSGASMARAMFIRTVGDPDPLLPEVRGELVALSPELAYMTVVDMRTMIAPQLHPWRLGATMLAVFGMLALLIAAIGLYSALAYAVARRTHEIGIRRALGAAAPRVTRLIVWSGLRTVLVGIGVGLSVVLLAGKIIAGSVYGVSPRDPLALVTAMAVFTSVALIASAVPAWRAARVDPAVALRNSE